MCKHVESAVLNSDQQGALYAAESRFPKPTRKLIWKKMASEIQVESLKNKRKLEDEDEAKGEEEEGEDAWVGPMPTEAVQTKKKKGKTIIKWG